MDLSGLVALIQQVPALSQLTGDLRAMSAAPLYLDLLRSARPAAVAALHRAEERPLCLVTTHSAEAWLVAEQLRAWSDTPNSIYLFPEPDVLPYERMPWAVEARQRRLAALWALGAGGGRASAPLVVTSARAMLRKTLPPREYLLGMRTLRLGQAVNLGNLLAHWYAHGYEAVEVVEEPGQYCRRGGIIDIFSPQWERPVRLELFGDAIDSLRAFDPATQRSLNKLESITTIPAREALPKYGVVAHQNFAILDCSACQSAARNELERDAQSLQQSEAFPNLEFYIAYLYSQPAMLLDYLPETALLVLDDWSQMAARAHELSDQAAAMRRDTVASGELPSGVASSHFEWPDIIERLRRPGMLILGADPLAEAHPFGRVFAVGTRYGGQLKRVLGEWQARPDAAQRQVVVSRQVQRLSDLLALAGAPTAPVENVVTPPPPGSLTLVPGALSEGWTLSASGDALAPDLILLTDAEVFGISRPEPRRPKAPKAASPETFFADVSPGDYVVHIEHGIGLFRGLVRLPTGDVAEGLGSGPHPRGVGGDLSPRVVGGEQEYLQVDYAEGDRLFVPIYQVDRLSRYMGGGDAEPPIYRLGSAEWPRVKAKARRAVEDIAEDLLELYAARQVVPGHAFGPDGPWQHELEASFPYVETQDQLAAIDAVKQDMETALPMDRLVTGDVGYGKTEVALRAAFKAVSDGAQVAVLVPTTVLAQQHHQTFKERLAPFPLEVEMLSRFRSHREQMDILDRLADGRVDIVIGTHRLIQKDVRFKNLGLLVIDEEQRFGVTHKERLKQMRREVDVLTLTATPIPRTLYMSLTGARDMSTIDTPPDERLPIKTRIAEYDDNLVRQAILREMNRSGQVFFVHNRVRGIQQIAQRVQNLVPDAAIAIGHGQMPEGELEQVMLDFAAGRIDVLVCTSIIESGLDIPNANTIIINRADQFGLAQLYQLRGRVGRSAVRAYAYLLYAPHQPLSDVATRRLEAISRASELGAGFQVAMYDLEIRGAGEFLGSRQHGHIAAVGFDLYTRMLAQAVDRLKKMPAATREQPAEEAGPPMAKELARPIVESLGLLEPLERAIQITLPLSAYVPERYVPQGDLRLQLYRRMARLRSEEEMDDMRRELEDRFGPLAEEVELLLYQLRLKVLALPAGVESIATDSGQVVTRYAPLSPVDQQFVARKVAGPVRVGRLSAWLPLDPRGSWRETLARLLQALVETRGFHVLQNHQ